MKLPQKLENANKSYVLSSIKCLKSSKLKFLYLLKHILHLFSTLEGHAASWQSMFNSSFLLDVFT